MPLWTYKLLLFANLAGMAYSAFLFFLKRGAVHPLFEKDREIRLSVTRRLGRFSLFFFACFTVITMGVFSLEWSESNVRALLLFEIAGLWLIERYYSRVISGMWEKRKGFYHGPVVSCRFGGTALRHCGALSSACRPSPFCRDHRRRGSLYRCLRPAASLFFFIALSESCPADFCLSSPECRCSDRKRLSSAFPHASSLSFLMKKARKSQGLVAG